MSAFDRLLGGVIWFCIAMAFISAAIRGDWHTLTWVTLAGLWRAQFLVSDRDNHTLRALLRHRRT